MRSGAAGLTHGNHDPENARARLEGRPSLAVWRARDLARARGVRRTRAAGGADDRTGLTVHFPTAVHGPGLRTIHRVDGRRTRRGALHLLRSGAGEIGAADRLVPGSPAAAGIRNSRVGVRDLSR